MNGRLLMVFGLLLVSGPAWCQTQAVHRLTVESNAVARVASLTQFAPGNLIILGGQVVINGVVWQGGDAGQPVSSSTNQSKYYCTPLPGKRLRTGQLLLARRGNDCVAIVSATAKDSQFYVEPVFVRRPFRSGEKLYPFKLEKILSGDEDRKEELRLKELVKQLGDAGFKKREAAGKELAARLPASQPVLSEALADQDPEIKVRAEEILAKAGAKALLPSDDELMALLGGNPPPEKGPPFLGIQMQDFSADGITGVQIQQVVANTVAAQAGIQVGDVVLSLDGTPAATTNELYDLIQSHEPGEEVTLEIYRDKKTLKIKAVLGTRTGQAAPQAIGR